MDQMMDTEGTRRVRASKERILREQERLLEQLEKSEKTKQMIYIVLLFGVMLSIGTPPEAQKLILGMLLLVFLGSLAYKSPHQIELEREYKEVSHTISLLEEKVNEDDPHKEVTLEIPASFQLSLPTAQNRQGRRQQRKKGDRPIEQSRNKGNEQGTGREHNKKSNQSQKGATDKPKAKNNQKKEAGPESDSQGKTAREDDKAQKNSRKRRKPRKKKN